MFVPPTKVHCEHEEMDVVTVVCLIIKPTNVKNKGKTSKVHEYSNEDKCFKRNSNYSNNEIELQWLRLVLWEKKLLEEFLGFTTKHVFPNLNQQVLEGEG